MSRLKGLLRVAGVSTETMQQTPVQACNPVAQHMHTAQRASRDGPIPGEIQKLIAKVMELRECPESDRQAFADDWRRDPEGVKRGLMHLADYYDRDKR